MSRTLMSWNDNLLLVPVRQRAEEPSAMRRMSSTETCVDVAGLLDQERSDYLHGLPRSREQLPAWDDEITGRKRGELFSRQRIHDRANAGPVHFPHAHHTRFTARIEDAASNLIRS